MFHARRNLCQARGEICLTWQREVCSRFNGKLSMMLKNVYNKERREIEIKILILQRMDRIALDPILRKGEQRKGAQQANSSKSIDALQSIAVSPRELNPFVYILFKTKEKLNHSFHTVSSARVKRKPTSDIYVPIGILNKASYALTETSERLLGGHWTLPWVLFLPCVFDSLILSCQRSFPFLALLAISRNLSYSYSYSYLFIFLLPNRTRNKWFI